MEYVLFATEQAAPAGNRCREWNTFFSPLSRLRLQANAAANGIRFFSPLIKAKKTWVAFLHYPLFRATP